MVVLKNRLVATGNRYGKPDKTKVQYRITPNTMIDHLLLLLCGLHSIAFAVFHLFFWKLLHWNTDLKNLGSINRGVMQILNIQLIFIFLTIGGLCLYFGAELKTSNPGRFMLGAMAVFWLLRLVQQFIFLKQHHWAMLLLTGMFLLGAGLFAFAVFL